MSAAVPRRRDAVPERGDWVSGFGVKALPGLARGLRMRRVTGEAVSRRAGGPMGWTDMAAIAGEGPAKAVEPEVYARANAWARVLSKRVAEASK